MTLGPHAVVVLRATSTEDEYGNPVDQWDTAAERVVEGCSVQPVQGDEATVGRETIVSRWRVYAPVDADIEATDRLRYAEAVYEVDGEVQRWDFSPLPHLTCLLRRSHS